MKAGTHAALSQRGVPNVGMKRDSGAPGAERSDDVERQSPRVEVEHDVGEEPEVECRYALLCIRMILREIERRLTRFSDAELQIPPAESLCAIAGLVQLLCKPGVHVRDVKLLEVVVAVESPVRVDQIFLGGRGVASELLARHP